MCRLKKKASALSDKDLFDIVQSKHLKIAEPERAANAPRRENDVAAEGVLPSTD